MTRPTPIQPVVLAGGKSTRFGSNKALHIWRGKPLVEHVVDTALQVLGADEVWISLSRMDDHPRLVDRLAGRGELVFIEDAATLRGPLAGLSASLSYARRRDVDWVFAAACDMPGLRVPLLAGLQERTLDADPSVCAVIPRTYHDGCRRFEPLHAFYRPAPTLQALERYAETGRRSLQGLIEALSCKDVVEHDELDVIDPEWRQALTNVNRPVELDYLESL